MARLTPETSVLAAGTQVAGRISGKGALRIEGTVQGEVAVEGRSEIADGAKVEGDLTAESLDVAGELRGDARCSGPIHVRSGATVRGELIGASVAIEAGANVDVRLETDFSLDFGATGRRR